MSAIFIYAQALNNPHYEMQRLYGMGESLYRELLSLHPTIACRIYAPVGESKELIPYLIRRLVENGASSSFLRALNDLQGCTLETLVAEPSVLSMEEGEDRPLPIPLPCNIFQPKRLNSSGLNLQSRQLLVELFEAIKPLHELQYFGKDQDQLIRNPADRSHILGSRHLHTSNECNEALEQAHRYVATWGASTPASRADRLERLAELIEESRVPLMQLLIVENGKTLKNAHSEVREAIDFCRYYAAEVREKLVTPTALPGPTGEDNMLFYEGRGVFLCVSPSNFPLSIFLGQAMAALAAGNTVIAKPASDGELVTRKVAELVYKAAFPQEAFTVIYCPARVFATHFLSDDRVAGLAFTGSLESGSAINIQLAQRKSGIATTIMETGGQNAMLVDSTALPEQVVRNIVHSAFDNAGQRCSALRMLFLQEEIADRIIELLIDRVKLLKIGNPLDPEVDVGPVINENAKNMLYKHLDFLEREGHIIVSADIDSELVQSGYYVPPTVAEIESMALLQKEIFGPILHIIRFNGDALGEVVDQINGAHYGLTLGIHSRIESRAFDLARKVRAGNVYINREMIGSVVGSQPFGGLGLSGTGPKTGGPNYLIRFAAEKVISNNVAAVGGNLRLLSGGR